MNDYEQLAELPGLRRLFDLAWRTFGVNPALVSPDGAQITLFERDERYQPFCLALDQMKGGRELCTVCDRSKFLQAHSGLNALRYRCHAGLTEFIIPVIRRGRVIALLQCGQVHDRPPTNTEWGQARASLAEAGISPAGLRALFRNNRVLTPDRQDDLLDLLELIAARLANADERGLAASPGYTQVSLGRAMTFIEANLARRLTVQEVATAANLSTRTLMRLFRKEAGTSVILFIQQRRVARARQLLVDGKLSCAEIALECGFGSIQHFNRVFRRIEKTSPTQWRDEQGSLPAT